MAKLVISDLNTIAIIKNINYNTTKDTKHPNYGFLNTVVRSYGALTYQFLISYIPTTPYI